LRFGNMSSIVFNKEEVSAHRQRLRKEKNEMKEKTITYFENYVLGLKK
jgi:hypothetical protein